MDRLSEPFLSAGFHSSGAIPAQWIPHLPWALLLWGLQGREMRCLGGQRVGGGEHSEVMGAPSPYRRATLLFQSFHFSSGLGSLLGRGWEEKIEKQEDTRTRKWERQRQKKSGRRQDREKWRSMHRSADKSFRLYHLGRWVLFDSHFADVETEGKGRASQILAQEPSMSPELWQGGYWVKTQVL